MQADSHSAKGRVGTIFCLLMVNPSVAPVGSKPTQGFHTQNQVAHSSFVSFHFIHWRFIVTKLSWFAATTLVGIAFDINLPPFNSESYPCEL
eukprot:2397506-Amphidinium_carterae.2